MMMKSTKQDLLPNLSSVDQEKKLPPKGVVVMLSIIIVFVLLVAIPMLMDIVGDTPLPSLEQMEKRNGIITSVFKARIGRNTNSFFELKLSNEESIRYLVDHRLQAQLNRLKGQRVAVWSVPVEFGWGWWSYENATRQIQYQGQFILDYENEYKERIERNLEKAGNSLEIAVLLFLSFIVFASIWMITMAIRKMREGEKGENNGKFWGHNT